MVTAVATKAPTTHREGTGVQANTVQPYGVAYVAVSVSVCAYAPGYVNTLAHCVPRTDTA